MIAIVFKFICLILCVKLLVYLLSCVLYDFENHYYKKKKKICCQFHNKIENHIKEFTTTFFSTLKDSSPCSANLLYA